MKIEYVIIRDMAAGNETVGEMWQETRIFSETATLQEVMEWALTGETMGFAVAHPSRKRITITRPDKRGGER